MVGLDSLLGRHSETLSPPKKKKPQIIKVIKNNKTYLKGKTSLSFNGVTINDPHYSSNGYGTILNITI